MRVMAGGEKKPDGEPGIRAYGGFRLEKETEQTVGCRLLWGSTNGVDLPETLHFRLLTFMKLNPKQQLFEDLKKTLPKKTALNFVNTLCELSPEQLAGIAGFSLGAAEMRNKTDKWRNR